MTSPPNQAGVLAGLFVSCATLALAVDEPYKLTRIDAPAGPTATAPALPKEIPEPLAKLLEPKGLRLSDREGKLLCELWLVKELPLASKPTTEMGVKLSSLPFGALFGALRVAVEGKDYRGQPLKAGFYGLRYARQPSDGNHLGTADSRDFLLLTSLALDKTPAPVEKQDDLVALGKPVSSTDHALVLYLAAAEGEPSKDGAPRLFQRAGKEEFAADLQLAGAAVGSDKKETLRIGLVLVGHVDV